MLQRVWWQQPGCGVNQFLLACRLRLSTQWHGHIDWQPRSDVVLHAEVVIIQLTGNQWLPYGRSVSILASQSHEILLHHTYCNGDFIWAYSLGGTDICLSRPGCKWKDNATVSKSQMCLSQRTHGQSLSLLDSGCWTHSCIIVLFLWLPCWLI